MAPSQNQDSREHQLFPPGGGDNAHGGAAPEVPLLAIVPRVYNALSKTI